MENPHHSTVTAWSRRLFRADLHGTIFVACDKLTTGLRHDLTTTWHDCDCRSFLKRVLKSYDIFSDVHNNRKSCRGHVVSRMGQKSYSVNPLLSFFLHIVGTEDGWRRFIASPTWIVPAKQSSVKCSEQMSKRPGGLKFARWAETNHIHWALIKLGLTGELWNEVPALELEGLLQPCTTQRLDGIIFSKASVDKNTPRRIRHEPRTHLRHTKVATFVLMSWLDSVTSLSTQLSLLNSAIFELSNGGQSYREFVVQNVRLLVRVMA